MNPIHAVPIQAVAPTEKLAKEWERKTNASNRPKQYKNKPSAPEKTRGQTKLGSNSEKKNPYSAIIDISGVPAPFCSCSGVARRCYKSGPGGWQSSCCTNTLSEYPLPLSPWKPRKRISGRKMGRGPYRKLLRTLAAEGCDLSQPVDLKNHWAKHGTNKFVTIK